MRMYFDTETSDYWSFDQPPTHDGQPAPLQIAALLENSEGRTMATVSAIIDPTCWPERGRFQVSGRVEKIHGISHQTATRYGHHPMLVWNMYWRMLSCASELVGHNVEFDVGVHRRWEQLLGLPEHPLPPAFCTMHASTDIVRIPSAGGRPGYKWPNLGEAYYHFEKKKLAGAHDALADVYGARAVYRGIMRSRSNASNAAD